LHLVYLAVSARLQTRSLVYGEEPDLPLAREAQGLGAFYEPRYRIPYAVRSYIGESALPTRDRRDPARLDRRRVFRGGRRSTDLKLVPRSG
jgi:hypothetical protein